MEEEKFSKILSEVESLHIDKQIGTDILREFNKMGVMIQMTGRTKKFHSTKQKLRKEKYRNGEKKIQDLFGVRINLYFVEDIEICKNLLKSKKMIGEWETMQIKDNTFNPLKTNGVFELPEKYVKMINPEIWDFGIDKTFEIQIRTISFEGWHEIEHDLRYKIKKRNEGKSVWDEDYAFEYSRRMNAIVATLELCDKEMENNIKEFSYELFKHKKWDEFIRMHFRLRVNGEELKPEYAAELDSNEAFAKAFTYVDKKSLLNIMTENGRIDDSRALTVNEIFIMVKKLYEQGMSLT